MGASEIIGDGASAAGPDDQQLHRRTSEARLTRDEIAPSSVPRVESLGLALCQPKKQASQVCLAQHLVARPSLQCRTKLVLSRRPCVAFQKTRPELASEVFAFCIAISLERTAVRKLERVRPLWREPLGSEALVIPEKGAEPISC